MPKPTSISSLADVPSVETLGIVIGIDTRIFTTLAVASAARHLQIPLLIVDGHSNDGSFETLRDIDLPVASWLIRMERRIHGIFIDLLMRELRANRVLLIDSDIEVKNAVAFLEMSRAFSLTNNDEANVLYATGWSHGDHDMTHDGMPHAWFSRRAWIPFVLFDREKCAQLVEEDYSFAATEIGNELPFALPARLLAMRWHVGFAKGWSFPFLKPFRRERHGVRAAFYVYDTGAIVHEAAAQRGWQFKDIGWPKMQASVEHYEGATRSLRRESWTGASDAERNILATLEREYNVKLNA